MSALPTTVLDRAVDRAMNENRTRAAAYRAVVNRSDVNRANAQHSTGPRTDAGKQRSSLNAIRHGLTAQTVVLPSEDPAAYEAHRRQFLDEYQPATPTETQLVQELIDTSWRLNRIPLLELYKHKEQPWDPADHGFVFTKQQVECAAERMLRQNEARHVAYARFEMAPQMQPNYNKHTY